jgi:DNA primase
MGRIPEETIQQILAATDIVELVGRVVKLRRSGSNWLGLCPFHTEKSPSFNVYPHNHSYYCFGCGASGTAVRFLMDNEGMKFPEALKRLADAAGIRIQEDLDDPEMERQMKHRSALRRAHEDLAAWYHHLLLKDPIAAPARDYLKSRGITSAVAKNWTLGYAPQQDSHTRSWAAHHGYTDRFLVEAGIFKMDETGRVYAGFRHRLMFPIRSDSGDVIAFSGRLLDPTAKAAKYLNSPETPIFTKSKVLFGYDKSKRHINKAGQVLVCEGQIDLITAFEAGVQNVVAPLGTSFGEDHVRTLRTHAKEAVLCFDADNAGFKAAERAYNFLSPAGMVVRVARFPKGEDPDSLIRTQGVDAFRQCIEKAQDFLDFQIAHKRSQHGTDLRSQVMLAEQTAATIAMNPSISARDLMVRSHAAQLGLSEDALKKQVEVYARRQVRSAAEKQAQTPSAPAAALTPAQEAERLLKAQNPNSLLLAHVALTSAPVMEWLRRQDLDPLLHDMPGVEILGLVWQSHYPTQDVSARLAFMASLPPTEEAALGQLMARPLSAEARLENAIADLYALFTERLRHLIRRAQADLKRPGISAEKADELTAAVADWQKEWLDRKARSSDNP